MFSKTIKKKCERKTYGISTEDKTIECLYRDTNAKERQTRQISIMLALVGVGVLFCIMLCTRGDQQVDCNRPVDRQLLAIFEIHVPRL